MKKIFFAVFTLLIFSCWIGSCTKALQDNNTVIEQPEDSTGNNPPKDTIAEFNLDTSDLCSAISRSGNYVMGSVLTENEYMQVKINVTKAGKYSYSTDTLNGYYFSDSGKFESKGAKTLMLKGHGTPITAGNSKFTFKATTAFHTIAVLDTNVVVEPVPAGFYMTGKFGDMDFNVVPQVDVDHVSYGVTNGNDSTAYSSFVYPEWPNPDGTGALSLQKQYFYPVSTSTEADFREFFKPGAYPIAYTNCQTQELSAGIWVGWVDDQEVGWYVTPGGDQEGSFFKILGTEDGHRIDGKYYVKVRALLNCKVYRETDNAMRQLKDVEIVSYFIKGR
jgi:hypothetical protein